VGSRGADDTRSGRAAANENLFRRINERVEELSGDGDELPLVCECSLPDCVARVAGVTAREYEAVRRHPDRFFVAPGHERTDIETVVEARPGYIVVEKRGSAGDVARGDDPRSA
jgi:hypothetical protein